MWGGEGLCGRRGWGGDAGRGWETDYLFGLLGESQNTSFDVLRDISLGNKNQVTLIKGLLLLLVKSMGAKLVFKFDIQAQIQMWCQWVKLH